MHFSKTFKVFAVTPICIKIEHNLYQNWTKINIPLSHGFFKISICKKLKFFDHKLIDEINQIKQIMMSTSNGDIDFRTTKLLYVLFCI